MTQLGVFRDDYYNSLCVLAQSQVKTTAQASGTVLTAPNMAGAADSYVVFSGQAATAITTDTAANVIAQLQQAVTAAAAAAGAFASGIAGSPPAGVPNLFNVTYTLTIVNNNSGTLTLTGGAGVTISGTATLATNTTRVYVVSITSGNTITLTNVGSGTN